MKNLNKVKNSNMEEIVLMLLIKISSIIAFAFTLVTLMRGRRFTYDTIILLVSIALYFGSKYYLKHTQINDK